VPIDTSIIGQAAQKFMASLEAVEEFSDSKILEVGIVVEVRDPPDENEQEELHTPTWCSHDSRIYQTGLFKWAQDSAEWYGGPIGEASDDPDED
jgi:hypothetical protein